MGSGREQTAAFVLLYRSFDHRRIKEVCSLLGKPRLSERYQDYLRRLAVSDATQRFANSFVYLQASRHSADYDPAASFTDVDAGPIVALAALTMQVFDEIAPQEQRDVLALMLFGARS